MAGPVLYASADHWVAVFTDGVGGFYVVCGMCGYTERNIATSLEGARKVADRMGPHCDTADHRP